MKTIRKSLLVFAIMCTFNAYSQTVVSESLPVTDEGMQKCTRKKKRDVSLLYVAWAATKAGLGVCACAMACDYAWIFKDRYLFGQQRTLNSTFSRGTWHSTVVEAIFTQRPLYDEVPPAPSFGADGMADQGGTGDCEPEFNYHVPFLNMSNRVQHFVIFGLAGASIPLAYLGYRLIRSGCNTWRDEIVASAGFDDINNNDDVVDSGSIVHDNVTNDKK